MDASESVEIDDSLYSRQRYMLGDHAMKKMASSSVLLIGCDCLGVEIAKNLVLAGLKSLHVADSKTVSDDDLSQNFYVTQHDITGKKTRAEACVQRLAELNPYVAVLTSNADVKLRSAVSSGEETYAALADFVKTVDCVILSQCTLPCQNLMNKICRGLGKKFVSCNVLGVFSSLFCDFGSEFSVMDAKGEELKENLIANITHENPGTVTCLENQMHGLEDGDRVCFRKVNGMVELNDQVREVKVISPYAFTIGNTSDMGKYTTGGVAKQVLAPCLVSHQSFEDQLSKPDILSADFGKMFSPSISRVGFMALHLYEEAEQHLPSPWNGADAEKLWSLALNVIEKYEVDVPMNAETKRLICLLSFTCRGVLPPLAAVVGGVSAQEVLKAVTGKYMPLKQWLYLDASELIDDVPFNPDCNASGLSTCLHPSVIGLLAKSKVFMVGCGAIGCEMLKNLALLGVSTDSEEGKFMVTDNDVIEKSNLNRQFLFRSYHIRQHKSTVAAVSIKDINADVNITPLKYKVSPDSEHVFSDAFFEEQDVVINALDNVQARRYVDARCVSNQTPLVESGTMGPKGHVQVVVPFVTESYSSQLDPVELQVPYCTLKSFPSQIEHTIQWARDKFESLFNNKPAVFNKFWKECLDSCEGNRTKAVEEVARRLSSGEQLKDSATATKLLLNGPRTWLECVAMARYKFEKYFCHKALHLLHAFPLDTKMQDGTPFWSSPKHPPHPVVFDSNNSTHMQFIVSTALLFAKIHMVQIPKSSEERNHSIGVGLQSTEVPVFRPTRKEVITDKDVAKPKETESVDGDELKVLAQKIQAFLNTPEREFSLKMQIENFEKDDDSNYHIDFITSASNLRAAMYDIETADRLATKRIAGNIIPAISTTTAAVAGLATIQFIQLIMQTKRHSEENEASIVPDVNVTQELAKYRNCFLNLALPLVVFSEPAAAQRTPITETMSFTLWDRWEVHGRKDYKLSDFIRHFKENLKLTVSMVMQGVRMVYVPVIPGHSKRLNQTMTKLIKTTDGKRKYVDLTIAFENNTPNLDDNDDLFCPPIRYFFGQ